MLITASRSPYTVSAQVCAKLALVLKSDDMAKINVNIAEAAASISKARNIIHGPFKGLTDKIVDQDIKLPLVKLFEIADLQNQALEKLQIELEKLDKEPLVPNESN